MANIKIGMKVKLDGIIYTITDIHYEHHYDLSHANVLWMEAVVPVLNERASRVQLTEYYTGEPHSETMSLDQFNHYVEGNIIKIIHKKNNYY